MSDLKFTCPACGQHIQCDSSHASENLPCPACAHLVRVPADAAIVVKPPVDENAAEAKASYSAAEPEKSGEVFPTLEENFLEEAGKPAPGSVPLTEREHQIAEARKAHAAQAAQPVKPRLSFILSGGAAPPPEENEAALSAVEQKHAENPSHSAKTLNE
jgi:ribosomal protein S27E